MNIKRKFIISNIVMLVAPILLIGVVTVVFLALFIVTYPALSTNEISQIDLLHPKTLIESIGSFLEKNPDAVRYVCLWLFLDILIITGVVTGITTLLSKSILRPIKELIRAAQNIKDGNLDFEVMRAPDAEIDELCRVFDEMRRRLKESKRVQEEHIKERKMLIANISHDLKTPITSIKGYIEGIRDGVADTPEKMNRYLETIYKKANAIDEMINSLSIYSEFSKLKFDFELGDFNEFVLNIVDEHRIDLEKNNMRLETNISEKPAIVKIDYEKMRRVFANLIDNAIKYKDGTEGYLCVCTEIARGGVFAKLSDSGIGIGEGEIEKVFEAFYRADPSRNSGIGGSGLGLGIAKQIVEAHGGRIWLKSGENRGTMAVLYLPLRGDVEHE